ncbi:hypothetical protein [Enterococcus rivorum]|uniref:Uncharacterized protein n=1 Tax=Enterococcus rivorum TaxID=762845 RepID=A0A1E5KXM6_9ENTE|nr:hypothetical protein [Enterococcus rivorum]MBP2099484.1 putative component of type VI protein secretion system [Enterococcus rivorum]OEH82597.1 hypothetical protein BCR26_12705 [Enterococcus rivorum]
MEIRRVVVSTKEALQKEVAKKTDEILVEGDFNEKLAEMKKGQLSDTERMGVDLGGAGSLSLLEYGLNVLMDLFDATDKEEKKMKRHIKELYSIHKHTNDSFLLRLKQLDY